MKGTTTGRPQSCSCCGKQYGQGCVLGPACDCLFRETCPLCRRCPEHCRCYVTDRATREGAH